MNNIDLLTLLYILIVFITFVVYSILAYKISVIEASFNIKKANIPIIKILLIFIISIFPVINLITLICISHILATYSDIKLITEVINTNNKI